MPHHILVHAGIRPGTPLDEQTDHDLMWIRERFLLHMGTFGKIVIHGHTITCNLLPEFFENRIGIDTGAYASGVLTAAHIIGNRRHVETYLTLPDGSGVREFSMFDRYAVESPADLLPELAKQSDEAAS